MTRPIASEAIARVPVIAVLNIAFLQLRISLPPVRFKSLAAQTGIKMRASEIELESGAKKVAKKLQNSFRTTAASFKIRL